MGKNIVICCDGTGNQVEGNLSNVLKLFRILHKNDGQRVYYNPGIGTIGTADPWTRLTQNMKGVFELATGYGLDDEILSAYRFLGENYQKDDRVFLFGFSRGAYTVRALAGFIHMIGLLPPDQPIVLFGLENHVVFTPRGAHRTLRPLTRVPVDGSLRSSRQVGWLKWITASPLWDATARSNTSRPMRLQLR